MNEVLDALEREMAQLRTSARMAYAEQDVTRAQDLCEQLRLAENAWHMRLGQSASSQAPTTTELSPLLTAKEQLRRALRLVGVPATMKTIRPVSLAFFGTDLPWSRLASIRRDEERRYTTAPATQSYICPALDAKSFTPMRGLFALSDWPLEQRLHTPHSERRDFLTMATRIAADERSARPPVQELLRRMALEIPGAITNNGRSIGPSLIQAAEAELRKVSPDDHTERTAGARMARRKFDQFQQIFGIPRN
ncbi:hypothetical protein ABR737_00575 [Streptomyces sp. Edi2]|uniref:hypothetical protein n=1 Tax=Streptomyces sp. Edi2 TaxID=3162528 RepID=UPI0033059490